MNYYNEIKKELIDNEVNKKVKDYSKNKYEIKKYYNVGKLLLEAGNTYGEGIIKEYSVKLTNDLNIRYDVSSLNKMRKFYCLIEKMATVSPNLSYSHYVELLPYDDLNKKSTNVVDFVKNPIHIKNSKNKEVITEKMLQKLILEDIESFMNELGNSFCFIASEYKIRLDNTFNYIDLLLFNIEYNCYVVVELKVTELKKEHIGQIQVYMNYIDENLIKFNQDKTIGIIICKQDNKYVIKYCSDDRIIAREYELV